MFVYYAGFLLSPGVLKETKKTICINISYEYLTFVSGFNRCRQENYDKKTKGGRCAFVFAITVGIS